MNTRTWILSSLVTLAVIAGLNTIWYTVLMNDFYLDNFLLHDTGRDQPLMIPLVAANVLIAFTMAFLYERWSGGRHSLSHGLLFGAVVGILAVPTMDLMIYSLSSVVTERGVLVDSLAGVVIYSCAGFCIAYVHKVIEQAKHAVGTDVEVTDSYIR